LKVSFSFKTDDQIEERCSEIERANRILLQKMTKILSGPATYLAYNSQIPTKHAQSVTSVKAPLFGQAKPKTTRSKLNHDSST
jgi:hypothetical protein